MENKKKGIDKDFFPTLKRILKTLFSFYPVFLPLTLVLIVVNAVFLYWPLLSITGIWRQSHKAP